MISKTSKIIGLRQGDQVSKNSKIQNSPKLNMTSNMASETPFKTNLQHYNPKGHLADFAG